MLIEPRNEQGVIVAFSQIAEKYGYKIIDIQTHYPDARLYSNELGKEINAEFEHLAKSFAFHGHDPSQCDLLICWRNNWLDCPIPTFVLFDLEEYRHIRDEIEKKELEVKNNRSYSAWGRKHYRYYDEISKFVLVYDPKYDGDFSQKAFRVPVEESKVLDNYVSGDDVFEVFPSLRSKLLSMGDVLLDRNFKIVHKGNYDRPQGEYSASEYCWEWEIQLIYKRGKREVYGSKTIFGGPAFPFQPEQ